MLGGLLLVAVILLFLFFEQSQGDPANDSSKTTSNLNNEKQISYEDSVVNSTIKISAKDILEEFQSSFENGSQTARDKYTGKKVWLTGIVTGIFVPSREASLRTLESRGTGIFDKQGGADSFVTMGDAYPRTPQQTILMPGITIWSQQDDSLQPAFGQPDLQSLYKHLVVGKEATFWCNFDSADDLYANKVSISFTDCTLEEQPVTVGDDIVKDKDNVLHIPVSILMKDHPRLTLLCRLVGTCSNIHVTAELVDYPLAEDSIRGYTIVSIHSGISLPGNSAESEREWQAAAIADPSAARLVFHEGSAKYRNEDTGMYSVLADTYNPSPPSSGIVYAKTLLEARMLTIDLAIENYLKDVCQSRERDRMREYCDDKIH